MIMLKAKFMMVLVLVCGSFVIAQAQSRESQKTVLAHDFASLKGSLPVPADNISQVLTYKQVLDSVKKQYGIKVSPVKSLTFRYDDETTVNAIADGTVRSILDIENTKSVIVQHGDYLLVYSNLDQISLNKGDNITTGQMIGKITNRATADNYYELEILLYKDRKQLDPYDWFKPMETSKQML